MAKKKYTPKAFAEAVEKYFRSISYLRTAEDNSGCPIRNSDGTIITYMDFAIPPSITDLCLRLDICKDTFDAYMRDERYAETCRRAKLMVENWLVRQLDTREKSVDGIKFNLTYNFGWSGERREIELGEATRDTVSAAAIPMKEKLALITAVFGEISGAQDAGERVAGNVDPYDGAAIGTHGAENSGKRVVGDVGPYDGAAIGVDGVDGRVVGDDDTIGGIAAGADARDDDPDDGRADVHSLGGVGYYDDEDSPHGAVDHSGRG